MSTESPVIWGDPDVTHVSLAAATVLASIVALVIVVGAGTSLTELPKPRRSTLLAGLQLVVGLGVLLSFINAYFGGGPVASLALVVAPTLAIIAGMVISSVLGLNTPDSSGFLIEASLLVIAMVLGVGGYGIGRGARWVVGRALG